MKFVKKGLVIGSIFLLIVFFAWSFLMRNTVRLDVDNCESAGYQSLNRIHDMFNQDWLSHSYGEAITYSGDQRCLFINYNRTHEILSFGSDPTSGWIRHSRLSQQQFDSLAAQRITTDSLTKLMFSFPSIDTGPEIPTRLMDFNPL
ncbi:hypothetical protein DYBT9275_00351 [Dyadobacter sp. CECT 9275]|uniref:Uncharacterized protein n=1 Tax=Dyadobacter helix TaxID=2822344 RepID=A0A916NJJ5_9BACT|nr:hypothetical protein [Dyadobacter sp. CECT 9275]CAG4989706.1 hypothetical protein DYBT9275_00351 [Dyadobacter sp. CECT 9275]